MIFFLFHRTLLSYHQSQFTGNSDLKATCWRTRNFPQRKVQPFLPYLPSNLTMHFQSKRADLCYMRTWERCGFCDNTEGLRFPSEVIWDKMQVSYFENISFQGQYTVHKEQIEIAFVQFVSYYQFRECKPIVKMSLLLKYYPLDYVEDSLENS